MTHEAWRVAVNAPLPEPLTYLWQSETPARAGLRVEVPLGKRKVKGTLIEPDENPSKEFKVKAIGEVDEDQLSLNQKELDFLSWVSDYYIHPLGQVIETAFPPLKRFSRIKKERPELLPEARSTEEKILTEDQQKCVQSIKSLTGFQAHLLHGVTGSGKTEIYLELIKEVIDRGQSCLFLVPEISLTPQLVQRFVDHLGPQIAVIHSHLTEREKTNEWWKAYLGEKKVLLGARSALFCPLPDLGLIVIDEEHEPSFKQDEKLKYHGRDAAVKKAQLFDCPIILGSATPSMESYRNAKENRYHYHQIKSRIGSVQLPDIKVVPLKQDSTEREESKNSPFPFWMSPELYGAIQETLTRGEQVALFLNRRGMAGTVVDFISGESPHCPNCDISLTLHGKNHLLCHYCDYSESLEYATQRMGSEELKPLGLGTEKIESDLGDLFPDIKVARADRDEITSRKDLEDLIKRVEDNEVDVLVGTQMIAKGLDFKNLTLVGLVLADIGFNMPDFRACERSYQLITQMAGRAGRHLKDRKGKVIIQAMNSDHPSIEYSIKQDFSAFADFELGFRRSLSYPPYARMAAFRISSLSQEKAKSLSQKLRQRAEAMQSRFEVFSDIQILGPSPAPLARVRNQYRYQLLLKSSNPNHLRELCRRLIDNKSKWIPSGTKLLVDIDPQNLF